MSSKNYPHISNITGCNTTFNGFFTKPNPLDFCDVCLHFNPMMLIHNKTRKEGRKEGRKGRMKGRKNGGK